MSGPAPLGSAAFCWAGDSGEAAFFVSEALSGWEADGIASFLLVDFQRKRKPPLALPLRPGPKLASGELKLLGEEGSHYCRASTLPRALKDAQKAGQADSLAKRVVILLPEPGKAGALAECFTETLFLMPRSREGIVALGDAASALGGEEDRKRVVSAVVSGTDRIEDAAEFFLEAQEELSKRGGPMARTRFAGHFSLPEEKAAAYAAGGHPYRRAFAGDCVCGQLKAVGRRWLGDPATASSLGAGPGGASFAEFAKRLGDLAGKLA